MPIDIRVCDKVKCKYYCLEGCRWVECQSYTGIFSHSGCKVPDKCPYKAVQIAAGKHETNVKNAECQGCVNETKYITYIKPIG